MLYPLSYGGPVARGFERVFPKSPRQVRGDPIGGPQGELAGSCRVWWWRDE
jgi:hypothetical protein